jgi:hypothetical protein
MNRTNPCSRLDERVDRPVGGEDLLHLLHLGEVVDLPEVDVVGLEELERLLEQLERAVSGPVVGLRREERLRAPMLHDLPDVALAPALRTAVPRRGVDVVDPDVERFLHDGNRYRLVVGPFDSGLPPEAEEPDPVASAPQVACWHRFRGHGVGRKGWDRRRRLRGHASCQIAHGRCGPQFEQVPALDGRLLLVALAHRILPFATIRSLGGSSSTVNPTTKPGRELNGASRWPMTCHGAATAADPEGANRE